MGLQKLQEAEGFATSSLIMPRDRVGFPAPGDMRVQEQGASPQAACAAGAEATRASAVRAIEKATAILTALKPLLPPADEVGQR